jgi:hypothetical protein
MIFLNPPINPLKAALTCCTAETYHMDVVNDQGLITLNIFGD